MSEVKKDTIDKLIDYLDDNKFISIDDTKEALNIFNIKKSSSNPKYRDLLLKIVRLINKRTDETNNFVDIILNDSIDDNKKEQLAFECLPFKDGNINIEKLIFEAMYDVDDYKNIEDLLIDLVYDDIGNVDELKFKIGNMLNKLKIDYRFDLNSDFSDFNDLNKHQNKL